MSCHSASARRFEFRFSLKPIPSHRRVNFHPARDTLGPDTMSESPPLLKDGVYCTTSGRRNQEGWNIIFDSSISGFRVRVVGGGSWQMVVGSGASPSCVAREGRTCCDRRCTREGRSPLRPEMHAGGSHLLRPPPTDAMVAQERDPPAAAAGGNRPPFTHFTEMRPWRDFRYKITK